tara:strand:- start:121 stop:1146 length:1026 start_codon:yes stop_codon:yes gene_type:complete
MKSLPPLDIEHNINHAPHVVILGAGASLAAFPNGDINGRIIPLMRNIVEVVGLRELLADAGVTKGLDDFEGLYNRLVLSNDNHTLIKEIERQIHEYFAAMRLPEEVTIYDLLILSLREKDVIATFNWDPFLAQAFKRNRSIGRLPRIVFLHGNTEVGVCLEHRSSGFLDQTCSVCGNKMEPSQLLFPVGQKDYNLDPFIQNEWSQIEIALESAYLVTIFGYSAPSTDVEARSLLLNRWQKNPTRDFAEIDIVDIKDREKIESTWRDFFVRQHYGVFSDVMHTLSFRHPRRSCEAFAMATLQQSPWQENNYPETGRLEEIHAWLQPLLDEEMTGTLSGKPCP